jgi:EpsI family protein
VLPKFLKSPPVIAATLMLVIQAVLLSNATRAEYLPEIRPLSQFPRSFGPWQFAEEGVVDQASRDVLKADDLLNFSYRRADGPVANLFVAAFRTQRTGATPHSPKNCLPGAGWSPLLQDELTFSVGRPQPITANRYVISRGDARSLVLYWYQSRDRVVASEWNAKFWVMADAVRLNRTDTALVRVVIPIRDDRQEEATAVAIEFVQDFFGALRGFLPA